MYTSQYIHGQRGRLAVEGAAIANRIAGISLIYCDAAVQSLFKIV